MPASKAGQKEESLRRYPLRWLLGLLAGVGGWLLARTLRVRRLGLAEREAARVHGGGLFAFWHEQLLQAVITNDIRPIVSITSRSQDGEVVTGALRIFRVQAARGSSSRGGPEALEFLRQWVDGGASCAITIDGPRGPRFVVKPGIVRLARMTGRPIVPSAVVVDRCWRLRSWDRFAVAKPFSRVLVVYGAPIWLSTEDDIETRRVEVEAALQKVNSFAEGALRA